MKLSTLTVTLLLVLQAPVLYAQSGCSSDGATPPLALFERFINADCANCWADARTPAPGGSAAVLDWIVPSARGDEAALSAAARRGSLERLAALQRQVPQQTDVNITARGKALPGRFRVAFGPAVNDYVGGVVSFAGPSPVSTRMAKDGFSVWLALVEQIPAAVEGTAVPRSLVRGTFRTQWQPGNQLGKNERRNLPADTRWIDRVAMQLPAGTDAARLSLVGWMQDAGGDIVGIARAACAEAAQN